MRALILGIDGQDGSYLAELLLSQGVEVTGWTPGHVPVSFQNIAGFQDQVRLVQGDLSDQEEMERLIAGVQPDQVYNLAAPSFPAASWENSVEVGDIAGLGVVRLLEAIRQHYPRARLYQASSSELFGSPDHSPQNEETPFHPRNPYGIAKLYAHWMTTRYREHFGIFAVSGILFNHESPRRGLQFVTRKITHAAVRIKKGLQRELHLGDLEACRDWGYAGDYIEAMCLMLQADHPDTYVIGTGETHSVKEVCELAFDFVGLDYRDFVIQDPSLTRPPEKVKLVADASKARRELGWQPKVSFGELIRMMVKADLER
jgi:GDPmannose 4,6-dehydratase